MREYIYRRAGGDKPVPAWRRFVRRRDGSVAVEMGFVTIFFVTLLTGLISFGSIYFVKGNHDKICADRSVPEKLGKPGFCGGVSLPRKVINNFLTLDTN